MAILFDDGNSDHLTLSTTAVTTEPFTVAGWFYADASPGRMVVCGLYATGDTNDNYIQIFRHHTAPDMRGQVDDGTGTSTAQGGAANVPTTGVWHHSALVGRTAGGEPYEGYFNGALYDTAGADKDPAGLDGMRVGAQVQGATSQWFWSGYIGHVAVWSTGLSAAQVLFLGNGGSPLMVERGSLEHYVAMEGGSLMDLVTNTAMTDVNGTVVGVPVPKVRMPNRRGRGRSRYRSAA
jgi:hypothetical protein